jgi:hypothetical protein
MCCGHPPEFGWQGEGDQENCEIFHCVMVYLVNLKLST